MSQAEGQAPDLSLLKDMVGVRKALADLVARKAPVDTQTLAGILEAELKVYAAEGKFIKKEMALREVCSALNQGIIGVKDVLEATGVNGAAPKAAGGGFFSRLLGR
ncbi:MAG: hypothetical protein ACUVX9_08375 [Anaerolineae bacterium]